MVELALNEDGSCRRDRCADTCHFLGRCLEFCGQRGGSGGGAGAAGSYAYNQMDRPSNTAARGAGNER
ncbi:hypothetical protein B5X24_HaOG214027, partial [Helicoverpa armigera]